MNLVTVSHRTTYSFNSPVTLHEHAVMLRPRPGRDMRVSSSELRIGPAPLSVEQHRDRYGNRVEKILFDEERRFTELSIVSDFKVVHRPRHRSEVAAAVAGALPMPLSLREAAEVAVAGPMQTSDPAGRLGRWALDAAGDGNAFERIYALAQAVHSDTSYASRESLGTQSPLETLELATGTCRDMAYLLAEGARSLGYPARFVSGYLYDDAGSQELVGGASTHAWAQVHMPGAGWTDFDPTNDLVGGRNLVASAWVMKPEEASPCHGMFTGWTGAFDKLVIDVSTACSKAGPSPSALPGTGYRAEEDMGYSPQGMAPGR